MEKIKIMTVFGTRPEAIKMAPLVLELQKRAEVIPTCCVTAQHRQMLDSVLDVFGITQDYDLDIMSQKQTLSDITSRVLLGMEDVLSRACPELVLVHGDTSTAFSAALAAFYHRIPVGHVEAGLRSFDKYSPYPEEINRTLIGSIADFQFCPTKSNADNLARESKTGNIFITGNTVIDALKTTVRENYVFNSPELRNIDFSCAKTVLLTAHRRENYGAPMENIMHAVSDLTEKFSDIQVVYPVHLSPAVRDTVFPILSDNKRVHLLDPIDVSDMHNLTARSHLILTDSGGLQEEAPALGKPVLVLRRETERPEAVAAGTVKIAGVERDTIVSMASELLSDENAYNSMAHAVNPYGDGNASRRIADAIIWKLRGKGTRPEDFR